jgi:hypothetical protein
MGRPQHVSGIRTIRVSRNALSTKRFRNSLTVSWVLTFAEALDSELKTPAETGAFWLDPKGLAERVGFELWRLL